MILPLVTTTLAVLAFLLVLRFLGGGRTTLTTGGIAPVLVAAEIAQLTQTLVRLDVELQLPAGSLGTICLFALGLAVTSVGFDEVGKIVTSVGVIATLVDTLVADGAGSATALLLTIVVLWIVIWLVRW